MAPISPENTDRYFLDYEGAMGKRTMQFRAIPGSNSSAITTSIIGFLNVVRPLVYNSVQFTGLRKAVLGSSVSNPLPWALLAGTGTGTHQPADYPRYLGFVGRSSAGHRIRLYVYGVTQVVTADYRLTGNEVPGVLDCVNYLNGAESLFVAIDAIKPVWKLYGNQGYNAYHQRKRRIAS